MMLLDPSPGQLSDRITILKLKIEKAGKESDRGQAAVMEREACEQKLWDGTHVLDPKLVWEFARLFKELQKQNRKQWESEDAVRVALKACSEPPTYFQLLDVYQAEKPNAEGNEIRAKLVREIDELFNVTPEVKIYA